MTEMSGALKKFAWIGELAPRFPVPGSSIRLLSGPAEYYSTLLSAVQGSRRRVVLASLYLGNGPLEAKLVNALQETLQREKGRPEFRSLILLDSSRATRGPLSSVSMLKPLLPAATDAKPLLQLFLYHTPRLRGILRLLLPGRWNELLGVQHMKVGVFDDDVLLSGANLSESYFTNRQDRYVLLKDVPALADFYEELVSGVAANSFRVVRDSSGQPAVLADHLAQHPFNSPYNAFASHLRSDLESVVEKWRGRMADAPPSPSADTHVYPTLQVGPVGIGREDGILRRLLGCETPLGAVDLASGYFNLTDQYSRLLLDRAEDATPLRILSASPRANGFWGGSGVSGAIPSLYVHVAKEFLRAATRRGLASSLSLLEWGRDGWTFHAKGLWLRLASSSSPHPDVSVIGSSNYGQRSVVRDVESSVVVVTEDPGLRRRMAHERDGLFVQGHAEEVTPERLADADHRVAAWVCLVARLFRSLF